VGYARFRGKRGELRLILIQLRNSPLTLLGLCIVLGLVIVALLADLIVPYPEDVMYGMHMERRLLPPCREFLFGTDYMGRDILSRVIYGTRTSLVIGLIVVAIAATIGVILGLIAGYFGGKVDEVIMRITDAFLSIPSLILALAIAAALRPGVETAIAAIAITWWPWYARLVRAQTLSVKEQQFVEAAKAIGCGSLRVILSHVLPNCLTPVVVQASLDIGYAILTAAALGFLGVGAQPPTPEWGLMIGLGRKYFPTYWWLTVFPGLAIFISVLGFNLLGDGIRDLLDPRLRRMIRKW